MSHSVQRQESLLSKAEVVSVGERLNRTESAIWTKAVAMHRAIGEVSSAEADTVDTADIDDDAAAAAENGRRHGAVAAKRYRDAGDVASQ